MILRITHIKCLVNDEIDGDEIYFKYKEKKIWPKGLFRFIKTGQEVVVDIGMEVPEDEFTVIELWEYDLLSKNDYMGTFEMKVNEEGGPFTTSMKPKGNEFLASYLLTWEAEK